MEQKLNSIPPDGAAAQKQYEAEVATSSQTIAKPIVICRFISDWLSDDINGDWREHKENPNCFTDYKGGRAFYVYDDCVKYWDDIRVHDDVCEYPIPQNKTEIFNILGG